MYTIKEFMAMFKISRQTIYNWMKDGYLKTVKIGGKVLITQEEVDRLKKEFERGN